MEKGAFLGIVLGSWVLDFWTDEESTVFWSVTRGRGLEI
jgi:hypothetical protein